MIDDLYQMHVHVMSQQFFICKTEYYITTNNIDAFGAKITRRCFFIAIEQQLTWAKGPKDGVSHERNEKSTFF